MDKMILMVATSYNGKLIGNLFFIGYTKSNIIIPHPLDFIIQKVCERFFRCEFVNASTNDVISLDKKTFEDYG